MEIDKDILTSTERCESDYGCLINENHKCFTFTTDPSAGGGIIFTNCSISSCDYRIAFGDAVVCSCPVRNEIYSKYKK